MFHLLKVRKCIDTFGKKCKVTFGLKYIRMANIIAIDVKTRGITDHRVWKSRHVVGCMHM